jgi:hypothetical protein
MRANHRKSRRPPAAWMSALCTPDRLMQQSPRLRTSRCIARAVSARPARPRRAHPRSAEQPRHPTSVIISVEQAAQVDELAAHARAAGATLTKQPTDAEFFDGRDAYFRRPGRQLLGDRLVRAQQPRCGSRPPSRRPTRLSRDTSHARAHITQHRIAQPPHELTAYSAYWSLSTIRALGGAPRRRSLSVATARWTRSRLRGLADVLGKSGTRRDLAAHVVVARRLRLISGHLLAMGLPCPG